MKILNGLKLLSRENKLKFYKIIFVQIVKSFLEVISIASLIPLIYSIVNREKFIVLYNNFLQKLNLNYFKTDNFEIILNYTLLTLLIVFFIKTLFLIYSLKYELEFQKYLLKSLSSKYFSQYLELNSEIFLNYKKNDIVNVINNEINTYLKFYLQPLYLFFSEAIKIIGFSIILYQVNSLIFLSGLIFILTLAFLFKIFFKTKIEKYGAERIKLSSLLLKYIDEGVASFKELKLVSDKGFFKNNHLKIIDKYSDIFLKHNMLSTIPKYILEFLILIIIIIGIFLSNYYFQNNMSDLLIKLAIYAAAFFKLLPSINMIYRNYANIVFTNKTIITLHSEVKNFRTSFNDQELKEKISFDNDIKTIEAKNLSYQYQGLHNEVFSNVNLELKKNMIYVIKGESGSGKTTLSNLLMGFFKPKSGVIIINKNYKLNDIIKNWFKVISYLPQKFFLINESVRRNVAFAITDNQISDSKVWEALKKVSLLDVIKEKNGIEVEVGQDANKFSEGQKQRIGLARALYSDRPVMFLDEFTSALDKDNEMRILETLKNIKKDKIIIIISHSERVINFADEIIEIINGKVSQYENKRLN